MLWRLAARLVTGPLAFLIAGLIDILAVALRLLRQRESIGSARVGGSGAVSD